VHRNIDEFTAPVIDVHLNRALAQLTNEDAVLFKFDASERSLCFRLAIYLDTEFRNFDFNVDCEYNRYYQDPSRRKLLYERSLKGFAERKIPLADEDGLTVFPDIIVHRRETNQNLLVIEIKKTTSSIDKDFDLAKLRAYRNELGYRFAKFIRLGTAGESDCIVENQFIVD